MSEKSTPKGFLLSSTPVQSYEDSGYFGSNHRKNVSQINFYSPIKELHLRNSQSFYLNQDFDESPSNAKLEKILDYENFTNNGYEFSDVGISELSELEFTCDIVKKEENHSFKQNPIEKSSENKNNISSSEKNKDIKWELLEHMPHVPIEGNFKILNKNLFSNNTHINHEFQNCLVLKKTKVDFINELKNRNCVSLISRIFSYLSAKELCTVSCVNQEWNQVVQQDIKANIRKKEFIKERDLFLNGPSKENRRGMRCGPSREHKIAFSDLTNCNVEDAPLIPKDSSPRFNSFIKEVYLGSSKLLKCPKCSYASKCLKGNNYTCTRCSYIFCCSCYAPVFKHHQCVSNLKLPNITIGSKKSKKNLRRL